jgi:hypothetical protein
MIEVEVVNAFSSLGIIRNTKGGLEKYKASSVAESSHTLIAVMLGQNTKHEMMCDQKYKVKISAPEVECKLTDTFQGTFNEKVLRIPGCVVNAVADLDLGRDSWREKMCLVRQMGKKLGRGCYEWQCCVEVYS